MNSGCICCTLVGDFAKALKEVESKYSPDRIIIEPSGVGKLSDVIRAVKSANLKDTTLNAFCTVVDAKKCKLYLKNFGEFFVDQVENASCIVLSHTAVSSEKLSEAIELLKEHTNATIITTDWDKLDGKEILSAMQQTNSLSSELEKLKEETHEHQHHGSECCGHHHDHDEHHHHDGECCGHHHDHGEHHHHADEVFTSWGKETAKVFSKTEIEHALSLLASGEYGQVLRAKGIVDGGSEWIYFDYVPEESDIRSGAPIVTGRLCVIGCKLNEEKLKQLFLG